MFLLYNVMYFYRTTLDNEFEPEDPITEKLAIYTFAHRNHLSSLNYHIIRNYKVNWGLRKIGKIQDK